MNGHEHLIQADRHIDQLKLYIRPPTQAPWRKTSLVKLC
jgi:hypothetical protein